MKTNPRAHNALRRLGNRINYYAREDACANGKRSKRVPWHIVNSRDGGYDVNYEMLMDITEREEQSDGHH